MRFQTYRKVHELTAEGLSARAIAKRLGIARRTVSAALAMPTYQVQTRSKRSCIMDPHRAWLLARIQQYPELSAAVLHRQLAERGFSGGYSTVKQEVAQLRPRIAPVFQKLSFAPGECAQVDWGVWKPLHVVGGKRRLSFFVMTLCHSRMMFARFYVGEKLEYFLDAHLRAFQFFEGVPLRAMVDNCKTAVIQAKSSQQEAVLNVDYAAFSSKCGFAVNACTVRRPNEKGRVERAVRYVKENFLAGREVCSPHALNAALDDWLINTANVRTHGVTGQRPIDMFVEEKARLQALPRHLPSCYAEQLHVASTTCRVNVDGNYYSVAPTFGSRRLSVRRYVDRILIVDPASSTIAGDHARCFDRGRDIEHPAHKEALSRLTAHANTNRQLTNFLQLGSAASEYLDNLIEKRTNYQSHLRAINELAVIHGRDAVARALADAHAHQSYSSDYILNLLTARQALSQPDGCALTIPRNQDLLHLELPEHDLDAYEQPGDQT